ncbi:hypothetical protein D1007_58258 [Hordeum vulgare]|nr:hypothetical protein D1007_58258 [Hordeum vulgare]
MPSSPSPSPMTEEEEAHLIQRVLEDSKNTHDERQWMGLDTMLTLSAAGDVAVLEVKMTNVKEEVLEEYPAASFHPGLVGQRWSWSCTTTDMADAVGVGFWCPTPLRSLERAVAVGGGAVGAFLLPRTIVPPLDAAVLHRPN